jgi:acyl-CoA thioester hydrolase
VSIFLKTSRVKQEWADYNGHMNLAFYIHLFDLGWEDILEKFNMGEESAVNQNKTTFAVESHTTYDQEVKVGDEVNINLLFLDHDKKRLVYKLEMTHKEKKYRAATTEVCSLYVDLENRKVSEFEDYKFNLLNEFVKDNKKLFNSENLHLIHKLKK